MTTYQNPGNANALVFISTSAKVSYGIAFSKTILDYRYEFRCGVCGHVEEVTKKEVKKRFNKGCRLFWHDCKDGVIVETVVAFRADIRQIPGLHWTDTSLVISSSDEMKRVVEAVKSFHVKK